MSGCADCRPPRPLSDTNDGLSKHKERTFVTAGPAWQHVCGVRASSHQLVSTAQSPQRREHHAGEIYPVHLGVLLKSPLLSYLHLPQHCPVMSRGGLWSPLQKKVVTEAL